MSLTDLHSVSERHGDNNSKEDSRLVLVPICAPQATLAALLAGLSGNGDLACCDNLRQDLVTKREATATVTMTIHRVYKRICWQMRRCWSKLKAEFEGSSIIGMAHAAAAL